MEEQEGRGVGGCCEGRGNTKEEGDSNIVWIMLNSNCTVL